MMIKNARIIGIVTCAFVLFGGLYALVAKPVYSVDIVVQVENNGADMMGGAAGRWAWTAETTS